MVHAERLASCAAELGERPLRRGAVVLLLPVMVDARRARQSVGFAATAARAFSRYARSKLDCFSRSKYLFISASGHRGLKFAVVDFQCARRGTGFSD